jgi:hypothetical protein
MRLAEACAMRKWNDASSSAISGSPSGLRFTLSTFARIRLELFRRAVVCGKACCGRLE